MVSSIGELDFANLLKALDLAIASLDPPGCGSRGWGGLLVLAHALHEAAVLNCAPAGYTVYPSEC